MGEAKSKIVERIEREAGILGLVSILANDLAPSDLSSLLLEVYRQQVQKRSPAQVLSEYEHNRFVQPAQISPRKLLEWERTAYEHLPPEFDTLVLSPLCPLGSSAAVAAVDQNWAVSTSRNTEVVSDATNVLALESAVRRRELLRSNPKSAERVHLATHHRLVRPQFYDNPALRPHFSLFSLSSAGRDQGSFRFELEALLKHIQFYLGILSTCSNQSIPLRLEISDFWPQPRQHDIENGLLQIIHKAFPQVLCVVNQERQSGRGYYLGLCFHIEAQTASGEWVQLADGGEVNWTQRLLGSAKERLVISAIAGERVCSFSGFLK